MFASFVLELAEPPGESDYGLAGTPPDPDGVLPWRGFVESRASGSEWFYIVVSEVTGKWEEVYGIVTDGTPLDTLTRVHVFRCWDGTSLHSDGTKVDWQSGDGTLKVYCLPPADILELLTKVYRGTSEPPWKRQGTNWHDSTGAPTAVIWKVYDGAQWITVGTFNETANTFSAAGDYLPLAGGTMTGVLLLPAGSAGAPALARSNNTDTGIHFPTDQVAMSINGTNQLVVSASGLTVASSINVAGVITGPTSVTSTNGTNSAILDGASGGLELCRTAGGGAFIDFKDNAGDDYDVRIQVDPTNLSIINGTGTRLTIGNTITVGSGVTLAAGTVTLSGTLTGPASVLHIDSNGLLGTRVYTIATLPSAGSNNWRIAFASDAGTSTQLVYSNTSSWIAAGAAQVGPT